MRTVKGYVSLGLVGCKKEFSFEVEDGTPDGEIEEIAREEMLNLVEWGWDAPAATVAQEDR